MSGEKRYYMDYENRICSWPSLSHVQLKYENGRAIFWFIDYNKDLVCSWDNGSGKLQMKGFKTFDSPNNVEKYYKLNPRKK